MSQQVNQLYAFGPFVLDAAQRILLRDGKPVSLAPKSLDILLLLVRSAGRLVERDELMKAIWPHTFVEEGNVTKNIYFLRQALGNGHLGREYIETVPKRGYRFVARVMDGHGLGSTTKPEVAASGIETPAIDRDPLSALPSPSESKVSARTRRPPWRWAALLTAVVLAVAGGWVWLSPLSQPAALKITQITHFGRVDPISRLLTDGTRIYFVERRGGRYTLAEVPVGGGEPIPVPTPFPNIALFGISPDHSELLVGSYAGGERTEESFWLLPTSGGSPHRLGNVIGHDAAWSRDGQEIAYFSGPDGSSEGLGSDLYVVKPDGSAPRKLATVPSAGWFLRWAPDGKVLRLTAWDSKMPTLSIWEIDAGGSNLRPLLPGWREPRANYGDGESGGDWTPDGNYFVFRSTRASAASIWAISEKRKFLRSPSGTAVQLQTTDHSLWSLLAVKNKIFYTGDKEVRELACYDARLKAFVPYLPGVRASDVSFSRDGHWVAYVVATGQESVLWRSRTDGSERQQLSFPPFRAAEPRWSPDGKQIAFSGAAPGKLGEIFLVSSGGGAPEPVTALNGRSPDWFPGGNLLFFTAPVPASASSIGQIGTYQLHLGTRRVSVFPGAEALKNSCWSPDGRYLVAQSRDDRKLMLFDSRPQQWSELAQGEGFRPPAIWSRDSKYIYAQDVWGGAGQPILRVRISDRSVERIATLDQILRADVRNYFLAGLAPDGSPVVSLVLSHSDIYALDLDLP